MRLPPYPKYKPSGVDWLGDMPEHWEVRRLKFFLPQLESGVSVNGEKVPADDDSPGILKTSCVYGNRFRPEENKRIVDADLDRVACPVTGDSVIVSRMNTPELVGSCGYVSKNYPNLFLPDRLWIARFSRTHRLSGKYAWYLLTSHAMVDLTGALATGTSGSMKNLSQDEFLGIDVAAPVIEEQRAIADFLDRQTTKIDTLVAKKRKLIDGLREKRTALISRTVTRGLPPDAARAAGHHPRPKLKPSGIDWLGDVPEHWEVGKFSREVRIAEGQADPEIEPYSAMLLVAPNHIESGTGRLLAKETAADQGAISGKYLCRAGEVIYSKIRPALAKAVLAPEDCLCSADMYPMTSTGRLRSRYLWLVLLSAQFTAWSVLEADRVAMPKVNRETLNDLRLPVPPLNEQDAIANFLDRETATIDGMVAKVDTAIERLQEYRSALLAAAVTGKIDVRGAAAA